MALTEQQRRAMTIGLVTVGAFAVAQAWQRKRSYDFRDKVVVITGGSRGLGLVMARQLAAEGARLMLVARDEEELARAADDIRGGEPAAWVRTITADVGNQADAEYVIGAVLAACGGIDVLINNAGVIQVGPIEHMQLSDYEQAMRTHFWGPLHMVQASVPHMRQQGGGRIVNISSIGGKIAVPHLLPYSASKFALAGYSEGLRTEFAADNIVVTTVFPGLMRTGSPVNAMFKGQRRREYAWFAIFDSLPLASINAERAAKQIISACRAGDAELVITLQAKLAILARDLAPGLFAHAMTMVNGLLPAPTGRDGDAAEPGRQNESSIAGPPSPLTATTYNAAARNNEM